MAAQERPGMLLGCPSRALGLLWEASEVPGEAWKRSLASFGGVGRPTKSYIYKLRINRRAAVMLYWGEYIIDYIIDIIDYTL